MRSKVIEWARAALAPLSSVRPGLPWDDLERLGEMIGDASVVALSEGAHCAAEPLEFRNRVLQYLVHRKGFTAIAIEASGVVESRCINGWVRGGPGDADAAVSRGIGWRMDKLPQNRALVQWLREYNADPRRRNVNFYGFDLAGGVASHRSYWSHDIALKEALHFLERVDSEASRAFHARFARFMNLQFHPRHAVEGACYDGLSSLERDALTAAIADLIVWFERHETQYTLVSTADDYAWSYRAAIAARQTDNWHRQYPVSGMPSTQENSAQNQLRRCSFDAMNVRDRILADNIEWIVQQEGPGGKVLVFAARYHLSAAPLKVSWYPHREEYQQLVAGTYLRRRFGQALVTIGNLIGRGEAGGANDSHAMGQAPDESIDGLAAEVGSPLFLLDLRSAPADVTGWLNEEHQLVAGSQRLRLCVSQAFDVLFYIDAVTPARES